MSSTRASKTTRSSKTTPRPRSRRGTALALDEEVRDQEIMDNIACPADPAVRELAAQTKGLSSNVMGPATPEQVQDLSPEDLPFIPPPFRLARAVLPPGSTARSGSRSRDESEEEVPTALVDPTDPEELADVDPAATFASSLRTLPEGLNVGDIELNEEEKLLRTYLEIHGFAQPMIDAYNYWITFRLPLQVAVKTRELPNGTRLSFENVFFTPPSILINARDQAVAPPGQTAKALLPVQCRQDRLTYNMPFFTDCVLTDAEGNSVRQERVFCGKIPVMLGSKPCHLSGRTERERMELGECAKDPMGYFIIKGTERVILGQDKLRKNAIYVMDGGTKDPLICSMTTSTLTSSSKVSIAMNKVTGAFRMRLYALLGKNDDSTPREMNVFLAFPLMGVESEEDILSMILQFTREEYRGKVFQSLVPTLVEYRTIGDPVAYVARVRATAGLGMDINAASINREIRTGLFPHMSRRDDGTDIISSEMDRAKLQLLSMMICRLAEVRAGLRQLDDRDDWANKRCEFAATMMEQLFDVLWTRFVDNLYTSIKAHYDTLTVAAGGGAIGGPSVLNSLRDALKSASMSSSRRHIITDDFVDSFTGDKWGARNSRGVASYSTGVVEDLRRESLLSAHSQILRISTQTNDKNRDEKVRMIHPSQNRYVDSVDTPEGTTCGLRKAMAITAAPSIERDDRPIIERLRGMLSSVRTSARMSPCLVNGKFLGWVDGRAARDAIVAGRRSGHFDRDISVLHDVDAHDNAFYVCTEASRLVAPLLLVSPETGRLVIDDLNLRQESLETLYSTGCIENISALEERALLVAPTKLALEERIEGIRLASERVRQLELDIGSMEEGEEREMLQRELDSARRELEARSRRRPYTHCEIHPTAQFGVSAAAIPMANHNQAPRNVFQCSMGRQALGIYSSRHAERFDTTAKMLVNPNNPVFMPMINPVLGLSELPQGQMVRVLMGTFDGWGIEDSFVLSQGAIDRGLFQRVKITSHRVVELHDASYNDFILNPVDSPALAAHRPGDRRSLAVKAARNPAAYRHLDERGIVRIGSVVSQFDCLVGMARILSPKGEETTEEDMSLYVPIHESGTVVQVLETTNGDNNRMIVVKMQKISKPEKGDKFAPRNAQKGTVGLIVPQDEMPYDEEGPFDIIIDPHSQPSRMTLEMPIEILASKVGAIRGRTVNATSFRKFDINDFARELMENGFSPYATSTVYSGRTGRPMTGQMFSGFIFMQSLRHVVEDKIQAVTNAPTDPVYRQPLGGRSQGGAGRLGEMERDALISHGGTKLVREGMCERSDKYETVFCTNCGTIAVEDRVNAKISCRACKERGTFARATIPYVFKTLVQHLAGANIFVRVTLGQPTKPTAEIEAARDDLALARLAAAAAEAGVDIEDQQQQGDYDGDEDEEEEVDDLDLEGDDFGDEFDDDGDGDDYDE